MRFALCCTSVLASSFLLLGCGQSGALHLPSESTSDKPSKYLLYRGSTAESKPVEKAIEPAVQQEFPVKVTSPSN